MILFKNSPIIKVQEKNKIKNTVVIEMDTNEFNKLLGITDESEYESLQSSDEELPEPVEIGPMTYDKERMYIISTLKYLSTKVKQLSYELDELLSSK